MFPYKTVLLYCGNRLSFNYHPPKKNGTVWCVRCGQQCKVRAVADEIQAKCASCTFARRFGVDRKGAERSASNHSDRSGHKVYVREGGKNLAVTVATPKMPRLELLIDPPPF